MIAKDTEKNYAMDLGQNSIIIFSHTCICINI